MFQKHQNSNWLEKVTLKILFILIIYTPFPTKTGFSWHMPISLYEIHHHLVFNKCNTLTSSILSSFNTQTPYIHNSILSIMFAWTPFNLTKFEQLLTLNSEYQLYPRLQTLASTPISLLPKILTSLSNQGWTGFLGVNKQNICYNHLAYFLPFTWFLFSTSTTNCQLKWSTHWDGTTNTTMSLLRRRKYKINTLPLSIVPSKMQKIGLNTNQKI